MTKLVLTDRVSVPEQAVSLDFVRASGPGGQNVNKVATAVQLRLDLDRAALPEDVRRRLERLAGTRLTRSGELLIDARRFRTQERNRQDAFERLAELLERARHAPKKRVPTRPTKAAKERRRAQKRQRGQVKRQRGKPGKED